MKKVINRGKQSKTLNEVKPVENISKNLQSFVEISPLKKESFIHINCETMHMNPFGLRVDNLSQRNCQNQLSRPDLSHTQQECQDSMIQGKIHNPQNSNERLKYS